MPHPPYDIFGRSFGAGHALGGLPTAPVSRTVTPVNLLPSPTGGGGIGDLLGGVLGTISEALIGRLPLPPGRVPPQLPPGPPVGGLPAPIPRTIPTIGGRSTGVGRKAAAAAAAIAAAAAAGLGPEFASLFYNPPRRRMNVLNPRALRRSMRRVEGFAKFARRTISFTKKVKMKKRRSR